MSMLSSLVILGVGEQNRSRMPSPCGADQGRIPRLACGRLDALPAFRYLHVHNEYRLQTELPARLGSLLRHLMGRILQMMVDYNRAATNAPCGAHHLCACGQRQ